jgi:hypothetical protein
VTVYQCTSIIKVPPQYKLKLIGKQRVHKIRVV